jgi:hypothetical protein
LCRYLAGRHVGVLGLPRHPIEAFEHAPAGRQGVVDIDRRLKRLDRGRCLSHHGVAMSALLMEPTEARMMPLQIAERLHGVRDAAEIALGDGHEQQGIPLLRRASEQRLSGRERRREIPLPQQC